MIFDAFLYVCLITFCLRLICSELFVIPDQEISLHLLAAMPGFHRVLFVCVAAEVVHPALKNHLRDPLSGLFILVNSGMAAGIGAVEAGRVPLKDRYRCSFDQFQVFSGGILFQTAAAPGLIA